MPHDLDSVNHDGKGVLLDWIMKHFVIQQPGINFSIVG